MVSPSNIFFHPRSTCLDLERRWPLDATLKGFDMQSLTESLAGWFEPVGKALGPYAPRLLGALAILFAAWLGARLVRLALLRAASAGRLDERLHSSGLGNTLAGVGSALP